MGQRLPIPPPPVPSIILRARDPKVKKVLASPAELFDLYSDVSFMRYDARPLDGSAEDGRIGLIYGKPVYDKSKPIRCARCGGPTLGYPCDHCGGPY